MLRERVVDIVEKGTKTNLLEVPSLERFASTGIDGVNFETLALVGRHAMTVRCMHLI